MVEEHPIVSEVTPLTSKPHSAPISLLSLVTSSLNLFEFTITLCFLFYHPYTSNDCATAPLQHWILITLGIFTMHFLFTISSNTLFKCIEISYHTSQCLNLIHTFTMGILLIWILIGNYLAFIPGLKCRSSDNFLGVLTIVVLFDLLLIAGSIVTILNILLQSIKRKD